MNFVESTNVNSPWSFTSNHPPQRNKSHHSTEIHFINTKLIRSFMIEMKGKIQNMWSVKESNIKWINHILLMNNLMTIRLLKGKYRGNMMILRNINVLLKSLILYQSNNIIKQTIRTARTKRISMTLREKRISRTLREKRIKSTHINLCKSKCKLSFNKTCILNKWRQSKSENMTVTSRSKLNPLKYTIC